MNKGGGNRQQKPGNNANNNKNINNRMNNNNNSGMNGYGDVNLMTMDFEMSQRPQSRTTVSVEVLKEHFIMNEYPVAVFTKICR